SLSALFLSDTTTRPIPTRSLHDALPICARPPTAPARSVPHEQHVVLVPREQRSDGRIERHVEAEREQLSVGRNRHRERDRHRRRSEEHTSELQSREKLVCRLLLEKKTT